MKSNPSDREKRPLAAEETNFFRDRRRDRPSSEASRDSFEVALEENDETELVSPIDILCFSLHARVGTSYVADPNSQPNRQKRSISLR